jgi:hypothetical protein
LFAGCLARLPWRTGLGLAAGLSAAAAVARFGSAFAGLTLAATRRLSLTSTRGLSLTATCVLSLTATLGLPLTAPAVSTSASRFPARPALPLGTFGRVHERCREDAGYCSDGERFDAHTLNSSNTVASPLSRISPER